MIATAEHIPRQRNTSDTGANLRWRLQSAAIENGKPAKPQTRNGAQYVVKGVELFTVPCNAKDEAGTPSGAVQRMFPRLALDSDKAS